MCVLAIGDSLKRYRRLVLHEAVLGLQVWGHNLHSVTFHMFRVYLERMAFPGCQADRGGQVLLVPLDSW